MFKVMRRFALVYHLVRMVVMAAAQRKEVDPNRISFADALHWLAHAPPHQPLPALVVNPCRPNRIEPRVVKRRLKSHKLMMQPRAMLQKALQLRRKTVT